MLKKITKPYKNFDIIKFLENRPLSWSQFDCFSGTEWGSPEKWFERYVLGNYDEPTPELVFGSMIDKKIQNDPTFLPELERFPAMQYKMTATWKGIKMIGYADGFCMNTCRLQDFKTGRAPWSLKKAEETGQLTFYAAMLYIQEKIEPGVMSFQIDWLETKKSPKGKISFVEPIKIQTFKTKRTRVQVLEFLGEIEKVVMQMQEYVRNHD